ADEARGREQVQRVVDRRLRDPHALAAQTRQDLLGRQVLGPAQQQRRDPQALRRGPDAMAQEALVQVLDLARIEVRHWHGGEYTREFSAGNAKPREYSRFGAWQRASGAAGSAP